MQSMDYDHPDWEAAGRVCDWRNYINKELRDMWDAFSLNQKRAIADNAEEIASREEWD
jgi:hypothetical protein